MVKPLLDTCILIDYLNGVTAAEQELVQYPNAAISLITWMEVMVGARADLVSATRQFLRGFDLLPIDNSIKSSRFESFSGGR
jgi:hypothetical protein